MIDGVSFIGLRFGVKMQHQRPPPIPAKMTNLPRQLADILAVAGHKTADNRHIRFMVHLLRLCPPVFDSTMYSPCMR